MNNDQNSAVNNRVVTVLMSVVTFCITGILGFIWKLNSVITILEERDREKSIKIDRVQTGVNDIRLMQQEDRENTIKMDYRLIAIENKLDLKNPKHEQ